VTPLAEALRFFGVSSVLVGSAALGWMLSRSGAEHNPLAGVRGMNRRQARAQYPLWRVAEPVVACVGTFGEWVVGVRLRAWLDRYLNRCGNPLGLTPGECVGLCMLSAPIGTGLGSILTTWLGIGSVLVWALVPTSAALPLLLYSHAGTRRLERISKSLPQALELLALATSAGLGLQSALSELTRRGFELRDPLTRELDLVLYELRLGRTRCEALRGLRDRVELESVAEFVGAVSQAERNGTPLAEVLRTQAIAARDRESTRAEQAAARAGVRMIAPLFLLLLSVLLLVLGPMLMSLSGPGTPEAGRSGAYG
jgi:tight adherence protein C